MKVIFIAIAFLFSLQLSGQVLTHTYPIEAQREGVFKEKIIINEYRFVIPPKEYLIQKEKEEQKQGIDKGFKFAYAVDIKISPLTYGTWTAEGEYSLWAIKFFVPSATSLSINFSKFNLPEHAEMYIGNSDRTMVTGPITKNENNTNARWGSAVYKGNELVVEIRLPTKERSDLILETKNIACGYKEIFINKAGGFGSSGSCNVNVLCPLGNGWQDETHSVAMLLDGNSERFCSGAMIGNTCNTSIPYFLTANHCFGGDDVSQWKFMFFYWSPQCSPNQNGNTTVLFNGSQLRANNAASDFCLLELNQTPSPGLGIRYAGWNRSTAASTSLTGIHHPSGDVMKISRDNGTAVKTNYPGLTGNNHWLVDWDNGVTEPGSSGSPLFDPNHRIIGQLHGGYSACGNSDLRDWYGAFDASWGGGGTNATRLSNWLDPNNTGATSINTASSEHLFPSGSFTIGGADYICNSETFTVNNLPSTNVSVSWQVLQSGSIVSSSVSGSSITLTKITNGSIELDATITNLCDNNIRVAKKILIVGTGTTGKFWLHGQSFDYTAVGPGNYYSVCPNEYLWFEPYYGSSGNPATAHVWTISGNYTLLSGLNGSTLSVQAPPNVYDAFSISYQYNSTCGGWSDIAYGGAGVMNCAGGEEPYRIRRTTPEKDLILNGKPGIYPNPANTTLVIDIPLDNPKGYLTLIDINGRQVYQASIMGKRNIINVSSLSSGIYMLKLTINGKVETTKIVISK